MSTAATHTAPTATPPALRVNPRKRVARDAEAAAKAIAEIIAPKPLADARAALETAAKKVEPRVDQGLVDAYLSAEAGVGDAAVALYYACLTAKVHASQFGDSPSAKVRASEFNTAYKVARRLGAKGAKSVMDEACKKPGQRRMNIVNALRAALAVGDQLKGSALKANELTKAVRARVEQREAEKATTKQTRAPRPATLPKSNSPAAVLPALLASFTDAEKQLSRVEWSGNSVSHGKSIAEALAELIERVQGAM